jgi:hypothetical protein
VDGAIGDTYSTGFFSKKEAGIDVANSEILYLEDSISFSHGSILKARVHCLKHDWKTSQEYIVWPLQHNSFDLLFY